jgi:hypothetical protein
MVPDIILTECTDGLLVADRWDETEKDSDKTFTKNPQKSTIESKKHKIRNRN